MLNGLVSTKLARLSQVKLALLCVVLFALGSRSANAQTQNYFGTSGNLDANSWSANPGGPYDSPFDTTGGGIANFNNPAGSGEGALTVAGINATANTTASGALTGAISTFGNSVIPIFVESGVMLDFSTKNLGAGNANAGFIKNGGGILGTSGSAYGGGFTLNDGVIFVRGLNAMGGNATPAALNINGGIIASGANRDFSGKYSIISLGGDFQIGMLSSELGISSDTANFTFNTAIDLGTATRTVTIGGNGISTFSGVISGDSGAGLTLTKLSAATELVVFSQSVF
jgi:hypothetical protein